MRTLDTFKPVAEAVAKLMHPHAEVVLHDISSNSIRAIFNPLSKRRVGDASLIDDMSGLTDGPDIHGPFLKTTADGGRLKYVSTVLRDDAGEAIGLMCINFQLGEIDRLASVLRAFSAVTDASTDLDSLFADDWQHKIDTFVRENLKRRNRSLDNLSRSERAALVHELQAAGAFSSRGAASYIARVLSVSRATVYNDLAPSSAASTREEPGDTP